MIRQSLVVLALAACVAPCGALAADPSGSWNAEFETPIGRLHYTYAFRVEGAQLTGTASWDEGRSEIREGRFAGDEVAFVEMLDIGG